MAAAADILPERSAAAPPPEFELLRIGSYNIHRCVGTDGKSDVGRVAAVIREMGCDTVGLQEVDSRPGMRSDSRQLEFLATATGMQAVAGATIIRHDRDYGNALLTPAEDPRRSPSRPQLPPLRAARRPGGRPRRGRAVHAGVRDASRSVPVRASLSDAKSAGSAARDANGPARRRRRGHQRVVAARSSPSMVARPARHSAVAAYVSRVCADVRARSCVG